MSAEIGTDENPQHWHEDIGDDVGNRLNWLRAGVLGANDGIVSVAGIVMGVAGATSERSPVLVAGIAGLVAGALSMAAGEYVSVTTQRDSERAMLAMEAEELAKMPQTELRELAQIYERKGLEPRRSPSKVADGADRARRARRARRGRVRHRQGQPDQPLARRLRLDDRVHRRGAAAAAGDHA